MAEQIAAPVTWTPGPWSYGYDGIDGVFFVPELNPGKERSPHGLSLDIEANARLIAAAPDLYAALMITRGQWIHSVHAAQCLKALAAADGSGEL